MSSNSIPKVEFAGLRASLPGGDRWEAARKAVAAALHSHGCFEAVSPSPSTELREEMFGSAAPELFSLPLESKLRSVSDEPYHGYIGQIPHLAFESLIINDVDSPIAVQDFTRLMWPEGNSTFCNNVTAFAEPLRELVEMVQKMIFQSMGVDQKQQDSFASSITYSLRLAEYGVPLNQDTKIALNAHLDPHLLSVICQHKIGGLEIQAMDGGNWIVVPPSTASVTVIAGQSFQDLTNPALLNAIKAFSPLRLRVGGTLDNIVVYEIGSDERRPCGPFVENASALFGFNDGCLSLTRWDHLNDFFKKTGAQVIFGLNALNGRVPIQKGLVGLPWDHKNAESLIRYTAKKGYNIFGWELGNGLSGKGFRARVGAAQYAADLISLKKVVDEIYHGDQVKPLVLAPGGDFEAEWYNEFIDITKASSSLDVITHHIYILGPADDDHLVEKILNPSYLDLNTSIFSNLREVIRKSGAAVTAWVGEAGGAYNSGRHLVTDSFVSSFWYLDQLGMSASYDTKSYCRQSLIGGNYGLLNTDTFKPNPDYYSALLWHRLMGPKVLSADFIGTKMIRVYSHCAKHSKGITLLLLNLDQHKKTHVTVKGDSSKQREEYHLTAKDGNLHSQIVLLNGKALNLNSNGGIPALKPNRVDGSRPIELAPLSVVFAHLPNFHAPVCM